MNIPTDYDCVAGPDLETPLRLIRELDVEMIAGRFDLADRQHRGRYRVALESLIRTAERRRSALGWIGSRLEAEKIDTADRDWDAHAAANPAPACSSCGGRMTRIRRRGADHDVFTCAFCDGPEVRADAQREEVAG